MDFLKRTWVEIDLDKALYNLNEIRSAANCRKIMPIIKADAYGHGANILADQYTENGIEIFAVSNINEAIKLRHHGIAADILILGYTPIDYAHKLAEENITQAVYSLDFAKELSSKADYLGVTVKCHLKIDTGMSRLGFNPSDTDEIKEVLNLKNLNFEGIFTHFSSADSVEAEDIAFTDSQFERFDCLVEYLQMSGYTFKYNHCSNSAATLLRTTEGNLVRPGIILYGLRPSSELKLNLKPIMSLKSVVSMVKTLQNDKFISYGRTYKTKKETVIATLPVGYADGYPRAMSGKGYVIINGKKAPIVGRVCMDQMMVDVTEIENVKIGTEVTVIGDNGLDFDTVADICNTINYEIICNISVRVPRVYLKDGVAVSVQYLGGNL